MNYKSIIQDALQTTWTHKKLWLWGLFVAFFGGYGLPSSDYSNYMLNGDVETVDPSILLAQSQYDTWSLGLLIAAIILIFVIGFFLHPFFLSALIYIGYRANSESTPLSLRSGIAIGKRYMWRIIRLNIVIGIIFAIVTSIITIPGVSVLGIVADLYPQFFEASTAPSASESIAAILSETSIFLIIITLAGLLFFAAFFLALRIIEAIGVRGIVLRDMDMNTALTHGFNVFRKNLGSALKITFILLIIVVPITWGTAFGAGALVAPFVAGIFSDGLASDEIIWLITISLGIAAINVFIGGIAEVFMKTAWTRWYEEITDDLDFPDNPNPEPQEIKPLRSTKRVIRMVEL